MPVKFDAAFFKERRSLELIVSWFVLDAKRWQKV